MIRESLWVALGGATGSVLRYVISSIFLTSTTLFPLGTYAVNIIGSFIIGLLLATVAGTSWHHLCIVGFCGGFTTFSAFSAELLVMLRQGAYGNAVLYVTLSVVLCVIATAVGFYIGAKLK